MCLLADFDQHARIVALTLHHLITSKLVFFNVSIVFLLSLAFSFFLTEYEIVYIV